MEFSTIVEENKFKDLEPGAAVFEVKSAAEKVSKSGNPMIVLTMKVHDKANNSGVVTEYLVQHASWKIKQFLVSANREKIFDTGKIDAMDCLGATGSCMLRMEKGTGEFRDKIKVGKFIAHGEETGISISAPTPQSEPEPPFEDSDLPF